MAQTLGQALSRGRFWGAEPISKLQLYPATTGGQPSENVLFRGGRRTSWGRTRQTERNRGTGQREAIRVGRRHRRKPEKQESLIGWGPHSVPPRSQIQCGHPHSMFLSVGLKMEFFGVPTMASPTLSPSLLVSPHFRAYILRSSMSFH